jgi:hypothetical protein
MRRAYRARHAYLTLGEWFTRLYKTLAPVEDAARQGGDHGGIRGNRHVGDPIRHQQGDDMRKKLFIAALIGAAGAAALVAAGPATDREAQGDPRYHGPLLHHADADDDGAVSAAEWSAVFAKLDVDGDGTLAGDELPHRRMHGAPPPGAFAGFIAHGADADEDGAVTLAEYQARVAALDSDDDGELTMPELHASHARRHGGPGPRGDRGLPPFLSEQDADANGKLGGAELEALFALADADDDGRLAGDELGFGFRMKMRRHR